jgi:5-formyltetrahydrofolate cyclo-ligase
MTETDAAQSKAELRREALARRDALSPDERAAGSARISGHLASLLFDDRPRILAGYWPIGSEVDIRAALRGLAELEVQLALPVVVSGRVVFREWAPGWPVYPAGFGSMGPPPEAEERVPETLIVPLVGFDKAGHRLGYGKGFYDRAVAELRTKGGTPRLIGVAFSVQETPPIEAEPHDIRLDVVVTEAGVVPLRAN